MKTREETIQKLRSKGLKITPQRIAIIDVLEGSTSHPSVDEIYQMLSDRYPTISYATIYKTLETLCEAGEVREINIDPHKKRYDPFTHPHHHFRCLVCGKIEDISPEEIPFPEMPKKIKEKYEITDVTLYIYGICPSCKKQQHQHQTDP